MGGWLSSLVWGGDPDVSNPVSGLSRRDIHLVQKSWAPLFRNCSETGAEILRRLFQNYPETKEYFKILRKLPEDEYQQNFQFRAHVINLMTSLNMAITNLHQPELVVAMMHKLGESHRLRHIKKENFENLKKILVGMFTEVLKFNEATLCAWSKTVDFLYTHIFDVLDSKDEGPR